MAEQKLPHWPGRTYNWNRWDNDLGTLNLLGPHTVRRAVETLDTFEMLALGAPLRIDDAGLDPEAYEHRMVHAGKYDFGPEAEPVEATSDIVSIAIHGMTNSHVDALCHAGHHGKSFNGSVFGENVEPGQPARRFTVMDNTGIVTRAWFVDVPAARGVKALKPGTPVMPEDIEHLAGRMEPGDALVVRTGRYAGEVVRADDPDAEDDHGNWCGMHEACMDMIADWDVSALATDSSGDNFPSTTPECSVPIHILTEVYLGLPLIHHLDLETLSARMAVRDNAAFMFVTAPLRIVGGTGSPVSPLAIL